MCIKKLKYFAIVFAVVLAECEDPFKDLKAGDTLFSKSELDNNNLYNI
ncbi:MAG: hypothetical protein JXR63_11915 [Spirochaetales bacterium]|nr:hypothetical protein [Spirochaetales bacterium]